MSLVRSTLVVGVSAALSRILGFARDLLLAQLLGAGPVADAFLVAFRLPHLLRRVVAEGGLNPAFIPLYARLKAKDPETAKRFAGEAFAGVAVVLAVVVAFVEIGAGFIVLALAPGLDPETRELATAYTRLAFPLTAGVTLAALITAVLNAEGRVLATALAPLAVNAALILSVLLLDWSDLALERQAEWLSLAVSLSGLLHLSVVAVAASQRLPTRWAWPRWTSDLGGLGRAILPTLAAAGAAQFFVLAGTIVASHQPSAVSWLYYADRIFQLPLGLVGSAAGAVFLGEIASRLVAADRMSAVEAQNRAVEGALLLSLPAAAALAILSSPIVVVLLERGAFDAGDSAGTAQALLGLSVGLPFAAVGKVLSQTIFAAGRVRGAILATLAGLLATVLAALSLGATLGVLGIGLGISAGVAVHMAALAIALQRLGLWATDRKLRSRATRTVAATLVMVAGLMLARSALGLDDRIGLAALCVAGLALYGAAVFVTGAVTREDVAALRKKL